MHRCADEEQVSRAAVTHLHLSLPVSWCFGSALIPLFPPVLQKEVEVKGRKITVLHKCLSLASIRHFRVCCATSFFNSCSARFPDFWHYSSSYICPDNHPFLTCSVETFTASIGITSHKPQGSQV